MGEIADENAARLSLVVQPLFPGNAQLLVEFIELQQIAVRVLAIGRGDGAADFLFLE